MTGLKARNFVLVVNVTYMRRQEHVSQSEHQPHLRPTQSGHRPIRIARVPRWMRPY